MTALVAPSPSPWSASRVRYDDNIGADQHRANRLFLMSGLQQATAPGTVSISPGEVWPESAG